MEPRGRSGVGCLGSVTGVVALVGVVLAAVFAGLIVLGIVAAVVVIGLVALAVDRLLLAISPKRRERRAKLQRSFYLGNGKADAAGPGYRHHGSPGRSTPRTGIGRLDRIAGS